MRVQVDLIQTVLVSLVILFLGYYLNQKIGFLKRNNIPEPVVGGIVFSVFSMILFFQTGITFEFDMTLKNPMMLVFFTTVGLGASIKLLKSGGPKVIIFFLVASLYLVCQNAVGVSIAHLTDLHPLAGLLVGSITLSGGHGTGATYAELFADAQNLQGTFELAMAAATFGLVLGGLLGGPVTQFILKKHGLKANALGSSSEQSITYNPDDEDRVTPKKMMETLLLLLVCIAIGLVAYKYFKSIGIPLPSIICPLIFGIVLTNVFEKTGIYKVSKECLDLWGTMGLSMFLSMALMSLKLWELINVAGPMLVILLVQTTMMAFFAYFITFRIMGKNYDAAIMAGGHCGFGLGSTPTAVANMEALVSRYGPSPQAFLVVPMVGAFFQDISNALIIQMYMFFIG